MRAFSLACASTGNNIAARIAMMAMTTSNSMRVKARRSGPERGRVERQLRQLFTFDTVGAVLGARTDTRTANGESCSAGFPIAGVNTVARMRLFFMTNQAK